MTSLGICDKLPQLIIGAAGHFGGGYLIHTQKKGLCETCRMNGSFYVLYSGVDFDKLDLSSSLDYVDYSIPVVDQEPSF